MTRAARWSPVVCLLSTFLAGAAGTVSFRKALLRERLPSGAAAGVAPRAEEPSSAARPTSVSGAFLASAATGVFRAVAIDYLWIRAMGLRERGRFFEAQALARMVAELQPRLPSAWTFLANSLAYDVTAALPAEERYPWVLAGLELLLGPGLERNPQSPAIYREVSWIFYHKIGLDSDDAAPLYRSELARAFEAARDAPERAALLARWRIDARALRAIEARWEAELDLRAACAHALYWAEVGLRSSRLEDDRFSAAILRMAVPRAALQLASRGRPLRAPGGRRYAFVPDLRFAPAIGRFLRADLERFSRQPEVLEAVRRFYLEERARLVCSYFLFDRPSTAARSYHEIFGELSDAPPSVEDFVLRSWEHFFLRAGGEREEAEDAGGRARLGLAACLTAAVYLDLAGAGDGARGFRRLADLILARSIRPNELTPLPPVETFSRAVAARLAGRWTARPEVWEQIPADVKALAEGSGPSAEELGLPEPVELPFGLEVLDPASGAREP